MNAERTESPMKIIKIDDSRRIIIIRGNDGKYRTVRPEIMGYSDYKEGDYVKVDKTPDGRLVIVEKTYGLQKDDKSSLDMFGVPEAPEIPEPPPIPMSHDMMSFDEELDIEEDIEDQFLDSISVADSVSFSDVRTGTKKKKKDSNINKSKAEKVPEKPKNRPEQKINQNQTRNKNDDIIENIKKKYETKVSEYKANQGKTSYTGKTKAGKFGVNKILYILLAFFFGGFGVHKFYARKYFMGFIYLIFSWTYVPVVLGFIEALLALSKPADSEGKIWI